MIEAHQTPGNNQTPGNTQSFRTTQQQQEWQDPDEARARLAKLKELYAKLLDGHVLYTVQGANGHLELVLKCGAQITDTGAMVKADWRGSDNKPTIDAMVLMARGKGWRSVEMTGDDQFKREAWLELAKVGIATRNYQPTQQMVDELKAFQIERNARSQEEALRRQAEHQPAAAEPQHRAPMPGM